VQQVRERYQGVRVDAAAMLQCAREFVLLGVAWCVAYCVGVQEPHGNMTTACARVMHMPAVCLGAAPLLSGCLAPFSTVQMCHLYSTSYCLSWLFPIPWLVLTAFP
jgi:hypothetical protein